MGFIDVLWRSMYNTGTDGRNPKMKRPGFTFVEISAAIALLAVCAVVFAQLVALTTSERLADRTRQTASDQMQNVLERLAVVPSEKLAAGDFDKTPFETLISRSLPDGRIVFDMKTIEPDGAAFTVTVSWSNGEKRPRSEVSLFRLFFPLTGEAGRSLLRSR